MTPKLQFHPCNKNILEDLYAKREELITGTLSIESYENDYEDFCNKWSECHYIPTFLLPSYDDVDELALRADLKVWENTEKIIENQRKRVSKLNKAWGNIFV